MNRTCGIPLHASNSATAAPQNQLHLAECSCRKKLRGGLRGEKRGTPRIPTPLPQLRKINCTFATAPAKKFAEKICSELSKGHFFCNVMQCYNAIRGMPLRSATQRNAMQRRNWALLQKSKKVVTLGAGEID